MLLSSAVEVTLLVRLQHGNSTADLVGPLTGYLPGWYAHIQRGSGMLLCSSESWQTSATISTFYFSVHPVDWDSQSYTPFVGVWDLLAAHFGCWDAEFKPSGTENNWNCNIERSWLLEEERCSTVPVRNFFCKSPPQFLSIGARDTFVSPLLPLYPSISLPTKVQPVRADFVFC